MKPRDNVCTIKRMTGCISQEKNVNKNITQSCHFYVSQLGLRDAKVILSSQNTSLSSPSNLTLIDIEIYKL